MQVIASKVGIEYSSRPANAHFQSSYNGRNPVCHADLVLTAYLDEVVSALEYIRKTPKLTADEKRRFFK